MGSRAIRVRASAGIGAILCALAVLVSANTAQALKLERVVVTPANKVLAPGQKFQYRATAHWDTLPPEDITNIAEWTTSTSQIAKVAKAGEPTPGMVEARDPGDVEIRAALTHEGKKTKGFKILKVDAGPVVNLITRPTTKKLEVGLPELYKARLVYQNGYEADISERVTWSSTKPAIASVSNLVDSKGIVEPKKVGTTTIVAFDPVSNRTNSDGATTVLPAVTHLEFEEDTLILGRGMKLALRVEAHRTDDTTTDVTDEVTFTVSAPGVISLSTEEDTAGEVTGLANGVVTVTAFDEARGLSAGSATVRVAGVLRFVVVDPEPLNVAQGAERNAKAYGVLSQGGIRTGDLRKYAQWQTSNPSIAHVGNDEDDRGVVTGLSQGTTTLVATVNGIASTQSANLNVTPPEGPIVGIITRPTTKNLDVGRAEPFKARTLDSLGNTKDITERVTWSSSNPQIASVAADGTVTPHKVGQATITAFDPTTGFTNTDGLATIKAAVSHIGFDETQLTLGRLMNATLRVDAYRVDGSRTNISEDVEWFLSNPDTIKFSEDPDTPSLFRTTKNGTVVVNAVDTKRNLNTANGSGPVVIRVEGTLIGLEIKPDPLTLAVGDERNASAFGLLNSGVKTTDLRSSVIWEIDDPSIAVLGTEPGDFGRVQGVGIGTATITAREPSTGIETTAFDNLVVRGAITDIEVEPTEIVVGRGVELLLRATANREDGTTSNLTESVDWSSTPPGIVSIDENGVLKGIKNGTATIDAFDPKSEIAASDDGQTASVTVSGLMVGLEVQPDPFQIPVATRRKARAIGQLNTGLDTSDLRDRVTWRVDDPTVALVGNGGDEEAPDGEPLGFGEVYALAPGITTLHAKDPRTNHEGSAEITVLGEVLSIKIEKGNSGLAPVGQMVRYKVRATYAGEITSNISDKCEWSVGNPAVATVDNELPDKGQIEGKVIGGKTTVTVNCDGLIATADVEAVGAITGFRVEPGSFKGSALANRRFRAWIAYEGDAEADVTNTATWFSTNPSVATVDSDLERGRVNFHAIGTADIVAVATSGHVASSSVEVNVGVSQLKLVPNEKTILGSTGVFLKAIAKLSDGREELVTRDMEYTSNNEDVARISPREDEPGFVLAGNQEGTATITGTLSNGLFATSQITVDGLITALVVAPDHKTVDVGKTRRVVARATYDDGKVRQITSFVEFVSSDPEIATVESHGKRPGRVIGIAPGTVTITAVDPSSGMVSSNSSTIEVR